MTEVESLYSLFGLPPTCTDEELRREYRRTLLHCHPDMNPGQTQSATAKTKEVIAAYAALKEYSRLTAETVELDTDGDWTLSVESISVTFSFEFSRVDLDDIARRKKSFREAWKAFRQDPTDVLRALRLVHRAFEAERQDAIRDLLRNPVLIDAAPLMLDDIAGAPASETLTAWADYLYQHQMPGAGIQILEDSFSTGKTGQRLAEKLRSMHYGFAQGYAQGSKVKPVPKVRIWHLSRILELGFEYGYVHKLLAEAYHELGKDRQARAYLRQAYEVDLQLSGAVRISRALGFLPPKKSTSKKATKRVGYRYTRPEQIPSPSQIRRWATSGNWEDILKFADVNDYSPRLAAKSRSTIRQIAASLGNCTDVRAREILESLVDSLYWDVSVASFQSLAKIGNRHTLLLLQTIRPGNSRQQAACREAISYLKARIASELLPWTPALTNELMEQAKQAFDKEDFRQARLLLENMTVTLDQDHPLHTEVVVLLARVCAEMGDSGEAIPLVKPVLAKLTGPSGREVSKDLETWLWNELVFEPYDPANDEDYVMALEIHLKHALTSSNPDGVLRNLWRLTRWMELLGEGDMAQWIRSLIRIEAPGTCYVDSHDRHQYVREVALSDELVTTLASIHARIKTEVPKKLAQVMKGQDALADSASLLED